MILAPLLLLAAATLLGEAREALEVRHFEEAAGKYRAWLQENPDDAEAWMGLAQAEEGARHRPEALEAYGRLLALKPGDAAGVVGRARLLARNRKFKEALEDLAALTASRPEDPQGWWALGDVHLWAGHAPEAVTAFSKSLDLAPDNPDPRIGRARAYARNGNFKEAQEDLERVTTACPGNADGWWALGDVRLWAGEADPAVAAYSRALEIAPDETGPRIGRGRAHAQARRFDPALKDLQAVTRQHPEDGDGWQALGDIHLWMGRLGEAEQDYTRLIDLRPEEPESYVSRARVLHAQSKPNQARQDLRTARALSKDPTAIDLLEKSFGPPPKAPLPWQASLAYDFTTFSHDRSDWESWTGTLLRTWGRGSLALEAKQIRRFQLRDEAYAAEAYVPLWEKAYADLRLQVCESPNFLPRMDYLVEPYQAFGKGWESSVFYRHMDFLSDQVDLYGASLGKYQGAWYGRYRLTVVPGLGNTETVHGLLLRRYLGAAGSYAEAEAGTGYGNVEFAANDIRRQQTDTLALRLVVSLSEHTSGELGWHYEDNKGSPVGQGFTLQFNVRW